MLTGTFATTFGITSKITFGSSARVHQRRSPVITATSSV
jgi:hypothetical protein